LAAKRIYQIAKEFERDEKEIIEFLTGQGIKVGNRLSAISEDAYNMLKAKYTAPPEPEPVPEPPKPEPKPEPKPKIKSELKTELKPEIKSESAEPAEQTAQPAEPDQPSAKKKKKKKKKSAAQDDEAGEPLPEVSAEELQELNDATQAILYEGIQAGCQFIQKYSNGLTKRQRKESGFNLSPNTDPWAVLRDFNREDPDRSPAKYWDGVARLVTMAFRLGNEFGLNHRENLGELRNVVKPVGIPYEPREIFTDEENELFAEQQKFLFMTFGSGMGAVNDSLYDLKMYAERMKKKFEHINHLEYVTNPAYPLRSADRVPFSEVVDNVCASLSGIGRRLYFYNNNKEHVVASIENFFAWIDGYAKLKEQGAPAEKLEKYLSLEKKFISLVEFMSMDNLLFLKKKPAPFATALAILNEYRDNMDDPDAERNFKYKIRGITLVLYKPKEFVFLYQLANLEPHKDYRSPEMIAAAEAAKAQAEAEAAAKAAAETAEAEAAAQEENPANDGEA